MRKIINLKLILVLSIISILSSCKSTEALWESDLQSDEIVAFFVDKAHDRIVFIGEYDYMLAGKDHYHYPLKEPKNKDDIYEDPKLIKLYESSKGITEEYKFFMANVGVKGKSVWGSRMEIVMKLKKNISKKKSIILKKELGDYYVETTRTIYLDFDNHPMNSPYHTFDKGIMTRYPSSKEKFKNFCKDKNYYKYILAKSMPTEVTSKNSINTQIDSKDCAKVIKLARPWKGMVTNYNSNTQIAYKTAATPFTIAFDIVSIPFYMVIMVLAGAGMSQN